jgi:hypothetical protein
MAIGGGPATPTANDFFFLVWTVGGGRTILGGRSHPMAIGGGPATSNNQRFFFFFWAIVGSRTTPNGHGVASATQIGQSGAELARYTASLSARQPKKLREKKCIN